MLFEETRAVRAFVGRIDDGDDVVEALTLVCDANDVAAAALRVEGTLRDVELVRFDAATRAYETLVDHAGPFEIVQLVGQLAKVGDSIVPRVNALLVAAGPAGQQIVFGQLRRGRAVDCEFVLETFEDLAVRRRMDASTGRFPISGIERLAAAVPRGPIAPPAPVPVSVGPPRERREPDVISEPVRTSAGVEKSELSWADAMEVSEELKPAALRDKRPMPKPAQERSAADIYAGLEDEPMLKPGDILDHPKLGECRVIKVEDEEYAHIRLSRGQIRKLALEVIELRYDGERDGKSVFKVRIRK